MKDYIARRRCDCYGFLVSDQYAAQVCAHLSQNQTSQAQGSGTRMGLTRNILRILSADQDV